MKSKVTPVRFVFESTIQFTWQNLTNNKLHVFCGLNDDFPSLPLIFGMSQFMLCDITIYSAQFILKLPHYVLKQILHFYKCLHQNMIFQSIGSRLQFLELLRSLVFWLGYFVLNFLCSLYSARHLSHLTRTMNVQSQKFSKQQKQTAPEAGVANNSTNYYCVLQMAATDLDYLSLATYIVCKHQSWVVMAIEDVFNLSWHLVPFYSIPMLCESDMTHCCYTHTQMASTINSELNQFCIIGSSE